MVGRRPEGDPPIEQVRMPERGFVYTLNKKGEKGFDYVLVLDVIPVEQASDNEALVKLKRWSPKKNRWVTAYLKNKIPLETFLDKNNENNYTLVHESPEEFYDAQNIPADKRPELPSSKEIEAPDEEGVPEEPEEQAQEDESEQPQEPEAEEAPQEQVDEAVKLPIKRPNPLHYEGVIEKSEEEYEREKAVLEQALQEARLRFVQEDYEYSTKSNKLTKLLGLRPDVIPSRRESGIAEEYGEALANLRNFEFERLQSTLDRLPDTARQQKIESFLLRYRYEEQAALYSLGKEVKSLAENETGFGKAKVFLQEIGNGYRQMSFKKKMAIGAGVIGLGALSGAGAGAAGIASIAWLARKIVLGTAAFLAVDESASRFLTNRERTKMEKEAKELSNIAVLEEDLARKKAEFERKEAPLEWQKLIELTNEKLKDIDKDLQRLKTRDKRVKIAAFAGAVGLPALGSWFFGGGGNIPSSVEAQGSGAGSLEFAPYETNHEATTIGSNPQPEVAEYNPDQGAETENSQTPQPAPETAEQREAAGYINSDSIGFAGPPAPEHPDEEYWRRVREVQGNATGPYYGSYEEPYSKSGVSSAKDFNASYEGGARPSADMAADTEGAEMNAAETTETTETAGATEGGTENTATTEEKTEDASGTERTSERPPSGYTAEMSNPESLSEDPAFEGRDIRALQRESTALLNEELWDIDNTELGPDHQFTRMTMQTVERQYQGRPIEELIAFNSDRYNYDPRIQYRENQLEWQRNRTVQLPPMRPYPTFEDGPDVYAIATMDQVRSEYRQNIGRMTAAAIRTFGEAAYPQNTLEHRETVREYMARIATLYTRARAENPNFRLNF